MSANARAAAAEAPDRRRDILRAAIEAFARKGYHGCRIADVARQAGVAYGLVYHYYRNKEELLQSVFAASWGRFNGAIDAIAKSPGTLAERVSSIVDVAMGAFRENPLLVRVLVLEIARSPVFRQADKRTAFERTVRATARLLAEGQKRGEMRPDVDPFVAAATLFGAIEVLLTAFVLGSREARRQSDLAAARDGLVAIFLSGVAPTRTTTGVRGMGARTRVGRHDA